MGALKGTGPKPDSDPTKHPGIREIRCIQYLMLYCALLPPDSSLARALRTALSLHEEPLLARVRPAEDLHPRITKAWLESIWVHDRLSAGEEELLAWQNDKPSMDAAVEELRNIEQQLGILLAAERIVKLPPNREGREMTASTILRHAAADSEFREELLRDPEAFGVSAEAVPASVEPQDESLEFWTEGVARTDIVACVTTCSFGLVTYICDGTTK